MLGRLVDLDAGKLPFDRRIEMLDADLRRLVARHAGTALAREVGTPAADGGRVVDAPPLFGGEAAAAGDRLGQFLLRRGPKYLFHVVLL